MVSSPPGSPPPPDTPHGVSLHPPGRWEGARPGTRLPTLPREIFMARIAELI